MLKKELAIQEIEANFKNYSDLILKQLDLLEKSYKVIPTPASKTYGKNLTNVRIKSITLRCKSAKKSSIPLCCITPWPPNCVG